MRLAKQNRRVVTEGRAVVDALENRWMMAVTAAKTLADVTYKGGSLNSVPLTGVFTSDSISGTVVKFSTMLAGVSRDINIELYDKQVTNSAGTVTRTAAPTTAANFLKYVNADAYDNTIFHRALNFNGTNGADVGTQNSVFLQGGSYETTPAPGVVSPVDALSPIPLEFSNTRPNAKGTIAMARTSDPNSATSGFFFNVADNTSVFNANNPYAVFGHVIGTDSQAALDSYAALKRANVPLGVQGFGTNTFAGVPVSNVASGTLTQPSNFVTLTSASVVSNPNKVFTYTLTSSDNQVVTPSLGNDGKLVLTALGKPGTAKITIRATDLTGASTTTAFTFTAPAPAMAVTYGTAKIADDQIQKVDLGPAFLNSSPTRTITIKNAGKGVLNLGTATFLGDTGTANSAVTVSALPATLLPGKSATLTLTLADTSIASTLAGHVTIANTNGALDGAFSFPVQATVGSSVTIGQPTTGASVKSVVYTDTDGTVTTFKTSGNGTAALAFSGTGLDVSVKKGIATVTGAAEVSTLTLNGTGSNSTLTVTAKGGNGAVSVGTLSAAAFAKSLALKSVTVTDALSLTGGTGNLLLAGLSSATATVVATGSTTLNLGVVADSTVSLSGNFKTLTATTLTGSTVTSTGTLASLSLTSKQADAFAASSLTAPSLGKVALGQLTQAGTPATIQSSNIALLSGKSPLGKTFSIKTITAAQEATDQKIANRLSAAGVPSGRLIVNVT